MGIGRNHVYSTRFLGLVGRLSALSVEGCGFKPHPVNAI